MAFLARKKTKQQVQDWLAPFKEQHKRAITYQPSVAARPQEEFVGSRVT